MSSDDFTVKTVWVEGCKYTKLLNKLCGIIMHLKKVLNHIEKIIT